MPTIVIASPKGGAGKSTTAVILGTELAYRGVPTVLLDCDPNRSISRWARKGHMPPRVKLENEITEASVIKVIRSHDIDGQVVIVDLEGVASRLMSRAISQADLVIIPMRATYLDAEIGLASLSLIDQEEEALGRKIPHAAVLTMTRGVVSRQHRELERDFTNGGLDLIQPSLMERAAFSALFEYGGDLHTMPDTGKMTAARENAAGFAEAVYRRLSGASGND
tara:strand:- start:1728 stop:2396 length:669 start_codon:yes stop_codon:yes gene_type:complete